MTKWVQTGLTMFPTMGTCQSMKLATYLEMNGLTQAAFAEAIGVSVFAVGKYVRAERVPRPQILARIRAQTGGEVTANDFVSDLAADCPTERAA